MDSEGRQMQQCWQRIEENTIKKSPFNKILKERKKVFIHDKFSGIEILFRLCYGFYGYGFMFPVVIANS